MVDDLYENAAELFAREVGVARLSLHTLTFAFTRAMLGKPPNAAAVGADLNQLARTIPTMTELLERLRTDPQRDDRLRRACAQTPSPSTMLGRIRDGRPAGITDAGVACIEADGYAGACAFVTGACAALSMTSTIPDEWLQPVGVVDADA